MRPLLCILCLALITRASLQKVITVGAAGATFPEAVYQRWTFGFNLFDSTADIQYTPTGSSEGKRRITSNLVVWGW